LSINHIIEAAKACSVEAIHPGYGFLSEDSKFADAVLNSGLIFVGPNPQAMKSLGDKLESRKIASTVGVPCVPGFDGMISNAAEIEAIASKLGFPVIFKASGGGGGKGMRISNSVQELNDAFRLAQNEAAASFSNTTMFMEKYIEHPRHIEFQVLGDKYGNVVWFPERDCSLQRRHQKILEETPSSYLNENLRNKMGEDAVKLAKAVNYDSVGTVEFLVKGDEYYFLEMNTRLQVDDN
jgi:acetyl/propionyl-CoA carboxylase alpha subunit